jgi:RimJ/RimL family protein N-acetyltransferase
VNIRLLGEHDAREFARLRLLALESEPQAFRETADQHRAKPLTFHAERLRSGGGMSFVFGAFDNDELIGTAGLYRNKPEWGCVWGMFVDHRHQGRGVGKQLLQALITHARSLPGITEIHLTLADTQHAARELYLRCGFEFGDGVGESACGHVLEPGQRQMKLFLQQP